MNNDLKGKCIVITQIRLHDYAGSEIVTLELANYFSECGAQVVIATHTAGLPILSEFKKIKNVKIVQSYQKNFYTYLKNLPVDIVWVHHQYIPQALIDHHVSAKFIYHHMSPYVELESPLFWRLEQSLADVITFNSQETRDEYVGRGYFADRLDRLAVFNNPAPLIFFNTPLHDSLKLKNVLVVSNHPPEEIEQCLKLLNERGVHVEIFGSVKNGKVSRVLPKHVAGADAVISIGKTVQYSLAVGTPVYCYDHFGGPGYLSAKNIQKAKRLNFSGRGFNKKTPERIADEIINGYAAARKFTLEARKGIALEFRIDNKIHDILKLAAQTDKLSKKPSLSHLDADAYLASMRIIQRNVRGFAEREPILIEALTDQVHTMEQKNTELLSELYKLDREIQELLGSRSYKIGKKVTYPAAKIKKIIKKSS